MVRLRGVKKSKTSQTGAMVFKFQPYAYSRISEENTCELLSCVQIECEAQRVVFYENISIENVV